MKIAKTKVISRSPRKWRPRCDQFYGNPWTRIDLFGQHDRVDDLGLDLMRTNNSSRHETAFTVSIEARERDNGNFGP